MITGRTVFLALATVVALSAIPADATGRDETARKAHDSYLAAINANDLDAVLAAVTDDIVLIAPNSPVMVGKSQVGRWVGGYFDSVETSWQKSSIELVVAGNWAFERYRYTARDTPRDGGETRVGTGNGINIYRRGSDGVWRVARDIWTTDVSMTGNQQAADSPTCTDSAGPC